MEESFMSQPSDSELHEMECDDKDWKDFLKKITLPLDEVVKATEDEEQDPEYNLMADEGIYEVDKEEFRVDKGVKVTKKELVNLYTELFHDVNADNQMITSGEEETEESDSPITIESKQMALLQQQMTQHVQMLTQNFILTYNHPELHQSSYLLKECLLDVYFHYGGKERSMFHTVNLMASLEIVNYWEQLLATNSEEVNNMKMEIEQTIDKSIQCHQAGNSYVAEFPALVLKTISNSAAFVYPSLLPKIPFKSPRIAGKPSVYYSASEDHLISLGLERFMPSVTAGKNIWSRKKGIAVSKSIQENMLPHREPIKIFKHINSMRYIRLANNPIKHFFHHGKAPPSMHFVIPLVPLLPPCRRAPEKLPCQWRKFIYPQLNVSANPMPIHIENHPSSESQPGNHSFMLPKELTEDSNVEKISPRSAKRNYSSAKFKRKAAADPLTKFLAILSRPSHSRKLMQLYSPLSSPDCSPKMNDCGADMEISPSEENFLKNQNISVQEKGLNLVERNIDQECDSDSDTDNQVEICEKSDQYIVNNKSYTYKDNMMNHSNDLMEASLSTKSTNKQKPSGIEKRRKENITLANPEDAASKLHKSEEFALAFYDRMREKLDLEFYQKIVRILNNHGNGDAFDLYRKIDVVLRPKYADLADEFLLFLRAKDSSAVDRLARQIKMDNRAKFLRKIEVYFAGQPSQLEKIYLCLTELSQTQSHSSELIKNSLLSMFEENSVLRDLFLQNFFDKPRSSSPHESRSEAFDDLHDEKKSKDKPAKRLKKEPEESTDQAGACADKNPSQDVDTGSSKSGSEEDCESGSNSSIPQEQSCEPARETSLRWRKEEDKVILEVLQEENDRDVAFKIIAAELTNRSIGEIESRFNVLMKLLLENYKHS